MSLKRQVSVQFSLSQLRLHFSNKYFSSLIESLSCSKGEFDEHENRIRDLEKENADLKEQLKFSR